MSNGRYQALAKRIENEARTVACVRGVPVDSAKRGAISARYRRVVNVLMRQAREAFAQERAS